jgi:hypothetical protein
MIFTKVDVGSTRIIKRFLLFPIKINSEKRWFGTYKIFQTYVDTLDIYLQVRTKWRNIAWVDDESNTN